MEAENVVGHSLRFGHGVKNFTAILFEDCDPRVEVTRVIGNVARQSNHRSDGHRGQLGSNLFFRVKNGSKAAAQIAVQPGGMATRMSEFVQNHDSPLFRTVKGFVRRHLNDVERRAVEGAFTSDPNGHAARLNDELDVFDALGDRLRRGCGLKGRDAVNLRSGKDRECPQHQKAPCLAAAVRRFVLDFDRLVEIDGHRLLALTHLPSSRHRLTVATPARVIGNESKRRHAEDEEVDAPIAMACRDVDRRRRCAARVRVPWSAPRRDPRLERGDNLVGEFLVVVASLCGMAAEVSHLAAPRNGIVPENSLPTLAWRPAGQGRASGPGETSEAARPAEPLRRRASMRDRSLSVLLHRVCIDLYSSSWMNKRSALRATWKAR